MGRSSSCASTPRASHSLRARPAALDHPGVLLMSANSGMGEDLVEGWIVGRGVLVAAHAGEQRDERDWTYRRAGR